MKQLIDEYLPDYRFREKHDLLVRAPAEKAYAALLSLDMGRSPLIRFLLWLRQLPFRLAGADDGIEGLGFTFKDFIKAGFIPLADDPPREMLLGVVGRFWNLKPDLIRLDNPEGFLSFDREGYAKVAANVAVEPLDRDLARISTETRIHCLGTNAARRFGFYWALIRPFSGLIRREWLRIAKKEAETGR